TSASPDDSVNDSPSMRQRRPRQISRSCPLRRAAALNQTSPWAASGAAIVPQLAGIASRAAHFFHDLSKSNDRLLMFLLVSSRRRSQSGKAKQARRQQFT